MNFRAPSSVTPFGGGALGSTALGVDFRHSRRLTACARCTCRSFAGLTRGAPSRGIRLLGANFPGAPSCDSSNTPITLSRGPWRNLSLEQFRLDRKQGRSCPAAWWTPPTTLMKIRIRRNVIKTSITSVKANSRSIVRPSRHPRAVPEGVLSAKYNASSAVPTSPSKAGLIKWRPTLQSDKFPLKHSSSSS